MSTPLTQEERRALAAQRAARLGGPQKTPAELDAEKAARNSKKAANNAAAARKAEILARERAATMAKEKARKAEQEAIIKAEAAAAVAKNNQHHHHQHKPLSPTMMSSSTTTPRPKLTFEEYKEIAKVRALYPDEIKEFTLLYTDRIRKQQSQFNNIQNGVKKAQNELYSKIGEIPSSDILDKMMGIPSKIQTKHPSDKFMGSTGSVKRGLNSLRMNNSLRKSFKRSFAVNSPLYRFNTTRRNNNNKNNNNNSRKSLNNRMNSDSRINVGFLGHGLSLDNYLIVPKGYTVTFYTECGIPLSMEEMLDSYYSMKSTYSHTYKEGSVFNNLKLHINPLMGNKITEYVGILPMVKGYLSKPPSHCNDFVEKVITKKEGYQYPSFYNVDSTQKEYCNALNLYNYNIGDRLSQLTGSHTTLSSVRDMSSIESEMTIFSSKIKNTKPLLRLVAKNQTSGTDLWTMFNLKPGSEGQGGKLHFNDFELNQLLSRIKPGDYHFYMCRSYDDERFNNATGKKTKRSFLSRQGSIKKARNNAGAACSTPDPETSPIFNHFGGDNGKIAVFARFIENILIPILSYPGLVPMYTSLEDIYIDESGRPLSDYVNTFLRYTVSTKTKGVKPTTYELMESNNKRYSRFVNIRDGDESKGEPRKIITFKNDEVFSISPADIEIINNLTLLMYHFLIRIHGNVFKLPYQLQDNEELSVAEAIMFSILADISKLNRELFTEGDSLDKFFKKIEISSQYYNVIHIDIQN